MFTGNEILIMLQNKSFVEGDRLLAIQDNTYIEYEFKGGEFTDLECGNSLDVFDLTNCKFIFLDNNNELAEELDEAEKEISKLKSIIKGKDEDIKKLQAANLSKQLEINDLKSTNEELSKELKVARFIIDGSKILPGTIKAEDINKGKINFEDFRKELKKENKGFQPITQWSIFGDKEQIEEFNKAINETSEELNKWAKEIFKKYYK